MSTKSSVWVAVVRTPSGDSYAYVFAKKPTAAKVTKLVWEGEGKCETLAWYKENLNINIVHEAVLE